MKSLVRNFWSEWMKEAHGSFTCDWVYNIKSPSILPIYVSSNRTTLAQEYWDKWGAIGNVLGEHLVNLWNMLGTHWEHKNNKKTKTNTLHSPQKKKDLGPLGYYLACLIGCQEFLCSEFLSYLPFFNCCFLTIFFYQFHNVLYHFWHRLIMAGAELWGTYCNQFGQDISVLG